MAKWDITYWLQKELKSSPFAWWEWDVVHNKVTFNHLKVTMLGYDVKDFIDCGYQKFTDLLHPDDYERTMEAMRKLLRGEAKIYQIDYRIRAKNGDYKWYMDRGAIIQKDKDGNPLVVRGLVLDLGIRDIPGSAFEEIIQLFRKSVSLDKKEKPTVHLCIQCHRIKLSNNRWVELNEEFEHFIHANLSHGICPDCLKILYPEIADKIIKKLNLK